MADDPRDFRKRPPPAKPESFDDLTPVDGDILHEIRARASKAVTIAKESREATLSLRQVVDDNADEARAAHKELGTKIDELKDHMSDHLGDLREFTGILKGQLELIVKSDSTKSMSDKIKLITSAEVNRTRADELAAERASEREHRRKIVLQMMAWLGPVAAALITTAVALLIHFFG